MATVTSHKQSGGHVWPNWPRTLRNTAAYPEKSKHEAPAGAAWDRRVERKGCARMVCTPQCWTKQRGAFTWVQWRLWTVSPRKRPHLRRWSEGLLKSWVLSGVCCQWGLGESCLEAASDWDASSGGRVVGHVQSAP